MKNKLCLLAFSCIFTSLSLNAALPSNFVASVIANADQSYSLKYKAGDKPPGPSSLACNTSDYLTNFDNLVGRPVGTPIDVRVDTFFSGTLQSTSDYSVVAVINGSGWSVTEDSPGQWHLHHAAATESDGAIKIRGTTSGGADVDCPTVGYSFENPEEPSTDTIAPNIPTGFQHVANVGSVDVSVDAPTDTVLIDDPTVHSHVDKIQFRFNGGTPVDVTAQPGLALPLQLDLIGGATGSVTQTGNSYEITDNGSTGWDGTSDQFVFLNAPLTGDGFAVLKVDNVTGGGSFGKAGPMLRLGTASGARFGTIFYQKNTKYQIKNRATTDGAVSTQANLAFSLPATFLIKLVGQNIETYISDDSGLTWEPAGNIVCGTGCNTANVGIAVTSQASGTPMTVTVSQWNLNNEPRLSYTYSTSSPVSVEARSFDEEGNASAWSGAYTATPAAAPPASAIKWHPGQYELSDNGANLQSRISYCTEARNNSGIQGVQFRYYWGELESTQGIYNFSPITQLLSACSDGTALPKKRVIIEIWWRNFGSSSAGNIVPEYVKTLGGTTNVYQTQASGGWAATIWRPNVADRAIALYQALGAAFDSHPYFEMVTTKETVAGALAPNVSDYSAAAVVTQFKRIMTAGRDAFPTTNFRVFANFLTNGTNAQMIELVQHAVLENICLGGPDTCSVYNQGSGVCTDTTLQSVVSGAIGGHDYRGEICLTYNAEVHDLEVNSISQLNTWSNTLRKSNYRSWMRYTWGSINNWTSVMLPFLNSNPSTVIGCPSSYPACDTD